MRSLISELVALSKLWIKPIWSIPSVFQRILLFGYLQNNVHPIYYPCFSAIRSQMPVDVIYLCEHRQWIWKVAPFVSAQRYPYPELLLPYKRQVWKVGPFRNPLSSRLDISLLHNFLLHSHPISWLLVLPSKFSFVPLACRALPPCELAQSVSSWQINWQRWQGLDTHRCQNKSLLGQSCSSAKANTSHFLKLKLCHWVMNHLHGKQRGGCWNFWSANMIGCLCLSAQWASTTEWRWQKRPLITNCPLLPAAKKKRLLIAGLPHGFLLQTQTMFSTTEKNTQVNFFANLEFRLKKGQAGWRWKARQRSLWHRSQNVAFSLNFFLKFKKETYYFFHQKQEQAW